MDVRRRCAWASREPLRSYHDREWGTPQHADRPLFEFLVLEGMQAGLSWETVLRKRPAFRRAFARFAPAKVASFGSRDVTRLLKDTGIIRNRAKSYRSLLVCSIPSGISDRARLPSCRTADRHPPVQWGRVPSGHVQ